MELEQVETEVARSSAFIWLQKSAEPSVKEEHV